VYIALSSSDMLSHAVPVPHLFFIYL